MFSLPPLVLLLVVLSGRVILELTNIRDQGLFLKSMSGPVLLYFDEATYKRAELDLSH